MPYSVSDRSQPARPAVDAGAHAVKLSIIMPVYNEEATVVRVINRLLDTTYPCETEVVVVDDGSTDSTPLLVEGISDPRLRVHHHLINFGKGAAVRTGARLATGSHALVFDADLEYAPADIPVLLAPVLDGRLSHVYGTRIFGNHTIYPSFWFAIGNKFTTFVANVLFDSCLTDLHTCLKLVPLADLRALDLRERGFGLDTELTANLLKRGVRPFEVPVTYYGRSHAEGKKITWWDGVQCLRILGRVRLRRDGSAAPGRVPEVAMATSRRGIVPVPSQPSRPTGPTPAPASAAAAEQP